MIAIEHFVGHLGRYRQESGGREYRFQYCPFCHYRKWSFYISSSGLYHCFHCGRGGKVDELAEELKVRPKVVVTKPTRFWTLEAYQSAVDRLWRNPKALEFLRSRGLTDETIRRARLGLRLKGSRFGAGVLDQDYITIPYIEEGGDGIEPRVVAVKYRGLEQKKFLREEATADPLYGESLILGEDEVHVTEGEFDCLLLQQIGLVACSVPNGAQSLKPEHADALRTAKVVFLWPDNDPAGMQLVYKASLLIGEEKVRVVKLPPGVKDVTDLWRSDPDGFASLVQALIAEAKNTGLDGFRTLRQVLLEFLDAMSTEPDPVFHFPWKQGTELVNSRPGELAIFLAETKIGKTTLMKQCALASARAGRRVLFVATETLPQEFAELVIAEVCPSGRYQIGEQEVRFTLADLGEVADRVIFHQLSAHRDAAIRVIHKAFEVYAPDILILDYLQQATGEDPKEQSEFLMKLSQLLHKYHVFAAVVSQPRKVTQAKPKTIDIYESRGTSLTAEIAAHFFILIREVKPILEMGSRDPFRSDGWLIRRRSRRPISEIDRVHLYFNGERASWTIDDRAHPPDEEIPF